MFENVAPKIEKALQKWPGIDNGVQIIGEPGRQIAQEAQTLVVQVFLVKQQDSVRHYYINNGVYQGFGCQVFDGERFQG